MERLCSIVPAKLSKFSEVDSLLLKWKGASIASEGKAELKRINLWLTASKSNKILSWDILSRL